MGQVTTVATVFLDSEISGTPIRICRIAKYLDRRRFRSVVVIPAGGREFAARLRAVGAVLYEVPNLVRPRKTLHPRRIARWVRWVWPSIRSVRHILLRERPAIVHAYGLPQFIGPLAAIGTGARVVWHVNDDSVPRWLARIYLPFVRAVADRITVSSWALARHYFGAHPSGWPVGVRVLYSTFDPSELEPTVDARVIRQELGVSQGTLIGMVGNIQASKGHLEFVRAAAAVRAESKQPVKFVVVGRELELHKRFAALLHREVRRLGLTSDVLFTGYRRDVGDILGALDILVVPSRWEPLGVIVMEGMAAGKPIVASNAGGIPEMIRDGVDGLLFPPGDHERLARRLLQLLEDTGLCAKLSQSARERVFALFAPEKAAQAYATLYEDLLGSNG